MRKLTVQECGSVSSATMLVEDVLPRCLDVLREYAPDENRDLILRAERALTRHKMYDEPEKWIDRFIYDEKHWPRYMQALGVPAKDWGYIGSALYHKVLGYIMARGQRVLYTFGANDEYSWTWADRAREVAENLLNEEVWNALDDLAPDGYYFGAHPGDGCDYGFWLSEESDEDFGFEYDEPQD